MADRFLNNSPAPVADRVIDSQTGLLTPIWQDYFARMTPTLYSIPNRINAVSLSGQGGNLGATDFSNGFLLPGLYRLTYYVRVVSTGGGSITVTFRWTDGAIACSFQGVTLVLGASETSGTIGESVIVRVDKDSPVTYATSFTGAQSYNLDVVIEKVYVL